MLGECESFFFVLSSHIMKVCYASKGCRDGVDDKNHPYACGEPKGQAAVVDVRVYVCGEK